MRLTRIEAIAVRVPLRPGFNTKTAAGEHHVSDYVIVRLHTDEGLVGLGEATVAPRWSGETTPGCLAVIEGLIAPELVGQDPAAISFLRARMDRVVRFNPFTKAAIEMALWDLLGKSAGQPLHRLLGGKIRDVVPIKMVVGAFDPATAVVQARDLLERGATCLKVKVGVDPDQDLARVAAVREAAGRRVPIGIDANQGWSVTTACRVLPLLEPHDILFAEQPIPIGDPEGWLALKRATRIPLMADESVFTAADAFSLTALRAVDILSVYPGKHGGIAATLEIAHIARAAGIACALGSNLELGIATAAMLQVAVASPTIASERYPADLLGTLYHESDLLAEPLDVTPAGARPPTGPGLGVALDEGKVDRYRIKSTRK